MLGRPGGRQTQPRKPIKNVHLFYWKGITVTRNLQRHFITKLVIVDCWLACCIRMDNLYWIKPMKILQKKCSWVCSSLSAVFTNKKISSITSWWQDWMEICLYCITQMLHNNNWGCYNEVRLYHPDQTLSIDSSILVRIVDFFIRPLRLYINYHNFSSTSREWKVDLYCSQNTYNYKNLGYSCCPTTILNWQSQMLS